MKKYSIIVRMRTLAHRNLIGLVRKYYNFFWGTSIGYGTRISLSTKIDRTNPRGIIIGEHTAFAFESAILTHDFIHGVHRTTKVGSFCFIGARAIIMPGVTIGDHCIIASGTVVMRDVASNSVVMGNPGRVIEKGILTTYHGMRVTNLNIHSREANTDAEVALQSENNL